MANERKSVGKAGDKFKERAKGKVKPKKGKGRSKAKSKGKTRGKAKGKSKDKSKARAGDQSKGKAKDKAKGKTREKVKAESGGKSKGKTKGKAKDSKLDQDEEPNRVPARPADEISQGVTAAAQRRWKQVAARLGLEKGIAAVAAWDGSSAPPILTGFSFVRHVESDARDLVCAGSSVTMTQGVIVEREDGKSFLTGRGVAAKFLGLQVPWKNRANAGQRALSTQERLELGQPEAQGAARPT